ncbi:hypothetical protein ACFLYF_03215 [Chloroflexota bacterium]
MTVKELQQETVANMKTWQKVENESIASTGEIMAKTENPIIRLVMEIIQRDSQMHYWVQGWIANTLEYRTVSLSPDELAGISDMISRHIQIERKMVESAEQQLAAIKNAGMLAQQYFINYLLEDERKHSRLLDSLEILVKGMKP